MCLISRNKRYLLDEQNGHGNFVRDMQYIGIIFLCVLSNINILYMYVIVTQLPISMCVDISNRHFSCA